MSFGGGPGTRHPQPGDRLRGLAQRGAGRGGLERRGHRERRAGLRAAAAATATTSTPAAGWWSPAPSSATATRRPGVGARSRWPPTASSTAPRRSRGRSACCRPTPATRPRVRRGSRSRPRPCGCRTSVGGDSRYARLEGTSMAAPQVTALAAMIGQLNPSLRLVEKLRIIKSTARGRGRWEPLPGLRDRRRRRGPSTRRGGWTTRPPSRACGRGAARGCGGKRRVRVRLRWRGKDLARRAGLVAVGRGLVRRLPQAPAGAATGASSAAPRRTTLVVKLRRGRYRLYTRVRDRSGNVEPTPRRADARLVVRR